jgi:hypothetical protein
VPVDLNGDGILDIVSDNQGRIDVWLGVGNGTFTGPTSYSPLDSPTLIGVVDFNGDGSPDVILANNLSSSLAVLPNQGGTLAPPISFATLCNPSAQVWGDFDGDGFRDLIVGSSAYSPSTLAMIKGHP